ncbi:DUF3907 family protein [Alkalibacillus flavidus]
MSTHLFSQAEDIHHYLMEIEDELTQFLNHKSVTSITTSDPSLNTTYIEAVVKQLRFLEVYCMEGKQALNRLMATDQLQGDVLEKVLRGIYHKCVNEFFSPKDDLWYEDSRAAYRGKCAIEFQGEPGEAITYLTRVVEPVFQDLREQLDYMEAV